MELIEYAFFRHALCGTLLISLCCGIIGTYVVTRRRVFIAGGITHASLGGLGLGVFLGFSPTLTAVIFAILTAVAVQWFSDRHQIREDSAIAVFWSLGMALGIIFIFLTPGYTPNLSEYLFGSILTISASDLWITSGFTIGLVLFSVIFRRPILYVAFDTDYFRIQGFRSWFIDYSMTILTAITIVLSIRLIGIVLLLSVLTLPQMMSNLFCKNYNRIIIYSSLICMTGCCIGLAVSFMLNVPAGACIVTILVAAYLLLRIFHYVYRSNKWRKVRHVAGCVFWLSIMFSTLCGCKSNTALNRQLKGLTTKYNIYFNGNEAYKEGVTKLETSRREDYTQRLSLHPVETFVGQKEPQQDAQLDRAIDKCKKCVQTKSITQRPKRKRSNDPEYKKWLTRGEYNPYLHNAWLLSGKAQFYKGDFTAAVATFSYIIRHYWWEPLAIDEAYIWTARCYAVQGFTHDAEAALNQVIPQKNYTTQEQLSRLPEYQYLTRQLQREFSMVVAEILLHQPGKETEAIPYLKVARNAFLTKDQRIRTSFLMAQLYEEQGNMQKAYDMYGDIIPAAKDYKTQFNARIAQTRVMQSSDLKKVEKKLNRMRRQKRNAEYLDQIYYALGNTALLRNDTTQAIENYELAIEKSTRNGMEKAVAALQLGELTFEQADYVKAQQAYAVVMGIIDKDYKDYDEIARLSAVLDELQTHAGTVELQDSLLHLATLDEAELLEVIDKIIEDLIEEEKKAEEEEKLAAYEERKSQETDPLAQDTNLPTVGQQDKSWYFYNPATVNAGKSDFQRRWGSRKPEDDWRRKNKTETLNWNATEDLAATDTDTTTMVTDSLETMDVEADSLMADSAALYAELAADPHNREYYLVQIPRTPEQVANSHQLIEDGLYNMGVIINEKLENFPLAISTFSQLETRFPETAYRLEFYYAIYLMYMRMNQPEMADIYRQKLMEVFPESAYAVAVSDPNYIETLRAMIEGQDSLYINTYEAYLAGETRTVHDNYHFVHDRWPLSDLMPKFLFLHALSFVQDGDTKAFQEALEQLTAQYPQSDVSPLASLMVKGIKEGRDVQTGEAPHGLMWSASLRISSDSTAVDSTAIFIDDDTQPHVLLLAYQTDSLPQNDLLFEIAKFNFENFLIKDFDLEIINTGGGLSVLVISGFDNLDELVEYHDKMDRSETLWLPAGITMIDISEPNFRALLSGKTFEEYFQWIEETYGSGTNPDSEENVIEENEPSE